MYTLTVQNKYGEQLELTHNEAYVIESIDGIDPPEAVINTTRNANADGSVFNSAYVDNRQITITLAINGPAEANRINLYRYFKARYPITLYYTNSTRDVYINGYVKNVQIGFFQKKQIAQITILCPDPYFKGVTDEMVEFSSVEDLFEFPFSIEESKNLLPNAMTTQTIGGITFTVNDDGTIEASGTSTDYTWSAYVNESGVSLPAGSYVLSGCPEDGSSTTYRLQAFAGDPSSPTLTVNDYGEGASFTLSDTTTVKVRMLIKGEIDDTFSPMIKLASVETDTYQEYGNPPGEVEFSEIVIQDERDLINNGDVETGLIIQMKALGPLETPVIYNTETNEYFKLDISMVKGDEVLINTNKKQKTVEFTANGATTNIIGKLANGSTWLTLTPGDNLFAATALTNPQYLEIICILTDQYEGV